MQKGPFGTALPFCPSLQGQHPCFCPGQGCSGGSREDAFPLCTSFFNISKWFSNCWLEDRCYRPGLGKEGEWGRQIQPPNTTVNPEINPHSGTVGWARPVENTPKFLFFNFPFAKKINCIIPQLPDKINSTFNTKYFDMIIFVIVI